MSSHRSGGRRINQEVVRSLQFLSVSFASAFSNLLYIAVLSHLTTLPFWLISLSSTEFSMVVNFVLNDRITFRDLDSNRAWYVRLARFQVAALGGNLLTAGISTFMHEVVSLTAIYAQVVAILLTFFFNFLVHRFWTFRGNAAPSGGAQGAALSGAGGAVGELLRPRITGVSVIIPVRNERATMQPLLLRLHRAMTSQGLPYEALIIDDRSPDGTASVAAAVIEQYHLPGRVQVKRGKPGKSYSLMEGFDQARYPVLAMIDGDLELPPEAIPEMVKKLSRYDVVVGKRLNYSKNNSLRGQLSAAYNRLILRLFLGINIEVQTGVKVFWRLVYESMELNPGQWGFDMEFIAKALADGFRIGDYDVLFQKRQTGESKVNPIAVAGELLNSAIKIKLDILQAAKAQATLKVRAAPNMRSVAKSRAVGVARGSSSLQR